MLFSKNDTIIILFIYIISPQTTIGEIMNNIFINTNEVINKKSILFLSNDTILVNNINILSSDNQYKLSFFEVDNIELVSNKLSLFDIIVFDNRFDTNIEKCKELFESIHKYEINIPIIILDKNNDINLDMYKNCNIYTIMCEPINDELLLSNIELCINFITRNKKVELEDGLYFDTYRELLFNNKDIVKLTTMQKDLLKLLITRKNRLVTYETIQKEVWKENTSFSKFTLRNMVKHIRDKSHTNIIKNSSNRGYIVNTF